MSSRQPFLNGLTKPSLSWKRSVSSLTCTSQVMSMTRISLRVATCVMLSFKESIIDMKKEFVGAHEACINEATKLMCEQIIKRLFISGLRTEIRQLFLRRRSWSTRSAREALSAVGLAWHCPCLGARPIWEQDALASIPCSHPSPEAPA